MNDFWKHSADKWPLWNLQLGGYLVEFTPEEWKTVNDFVKVQRAKRKKLNPQKKLTSVSKKYELINIAGEVAVAFCIGLKPDFKYYKNHWERKYSFVRDDGKSLIVKSFDIESYDIKNHESTYNVDTELSEIDPEEYKRINNGRVKDYADYYALASVDTATKFVILRGIASKEELLSAPLKITRGQGKEIVLPNNVVKYEKWKNRVIIAQDLKQDLWNSWFHPIKYGK